MGRLRLALDSNPWLLRYLIYTGLFLAATLVFMVARFPNARLLAMVNQVLLNAPARVEAERAWLTFPPGIKLANVTVAERAKPQVRLLTITTLGIRPSILAALTGRKKAWAWAKTLGGSIEAVALAMGEKDKIELNVSFDNIDPALGEWWSGFPWFKAEGKIGGEGKLEIERNDILTGDGWLKAEVKDGKITFGKSLTAGGAPLAIATGELELKLAKGMLTIGKGVFRGPRGDLLVAGGISLAPEIGDSRLNLVATLTMTESAKAGLGSVAFFLPTAGPGGKHIIRIGGTLNDPVMR
jgi:type II secretion system protein N